MTVKCIRDYNDLQLNRLVKAGEELTVAEARANVLAKAGVAVEIATTTPEVVTKPAPKKATTRKKKVEG